MTASTTSTYKRTRHLAARFIWWRVRSPLRRRGNDILPLAGYTALVPSAAEAIVTALAQEGLVANATATDRGLATVELQRKYHRQARRLLRAD
jgi:hypothetical protein